MDFSLQRGLPAGGPLALAGAVIALVALGLPWLSEAVPGDGAVLGYQDPFLWVAVRVVAAVAAIVLTLRVVAIEHERETLRVVYVAAAVIVVMRAIHWLILTTGAPDITLPGMPPIEAQGPMWGLFVSFLASGLFVAAAMAQHQAPAEAALRATGAGAGPADAGASPATPAAALDPDLVAFAAPGPVAPAPPTVTAMPAPAPVAPPAPAPGPVPAAPQRTAPPRSSAPAEDAPAERRSVAPPGFA